MQQLHDREGVLTSNQCTSTKIRVLQALREVIHVHLAMGIAWNRHTAPGMEQRREAQPVRRLYGRSTVRMAFGVQFRSPVLNGNHAIPGSLPCAAGLACLQSLSQGIPESSAAAMPKKRYKEPSNLGFFGRPRASLDRS